MKDKVIGILAIILGLIIIAFPMLGIIAASVTIGFSIMIMAIWLLIIGVAEIEFSRIKSILNIILGLLTLVLGIGIIFNPSIISFLAGIMSYLAGIILMVAGLIILIEDRHNNISFWTGVSGIILGIIYIIFSSLLFYEEFLGILIGIWLIVGGALKLINE